MTNDAFNLNFEGLPPNHGMGASSGWQSKTLILSFVCPIYFAEMKSKSEDAS